MRAQKWTDEWVRDLPHPVTNEAVFADPTVAMHRLTVKRKKKVFEVQAERPRKFGPRKTFVVITGDALTTTVEQARAKAIIVLGQIKRGEAPTVEDARVTTLGAAWERFKAREDVAAATLKGYQSQWKRRLSQWQDMPLLTLVHSPKMAEDEHEKIKKKHPVDANRAMRLLRAIYLDAADRDTTLPRDRHPCTSVRWAEEKGREGAIPFAALPVWSAQAEALRVASPVRASYHRLCVLLGTRPGELVRARWEDFDDVRKVLVMPVTKTHLYEIPLSTHAQAEIERLRAVVEKLHPGSPWMFPADSESGHVERWGEPKKRLSHSGNAGRHTFKTVATVLGVNDLHSDVLQGRSLLKAGLAGRGYIGRAELTEPLRGAAQRINDEVVRLMGVG